MSYAVQEKNPTRKTCEEKYGNKVFEPILENGTEWNRRWRKKNDIYEDIQAKTETKIHRDL